MMKSGKHDQDNKRRKKLKALRSLLRSYRDRLGESFAPDELKIIDGVLYRLNRGDWPRRNISDVYLHLGQFTHWTLTVPASMIGLLHPRACRVLRGTEREFHFQPGVAFCFGERLPRSTGKFLPIAERRHDLARRTCDDERGSIDTEKGRQVFRSEESEDQKPTRLLAASVWRSFAISLWVGTTM